MRTRKVILVAALTALGGLCVGVSILMTGNKLERTAPPAVSASSDAAPQVASPKGGSGSPWGENYFPNVPSTSSTPPARTPVRWKPLGLRK